MNKKINNNKKISIDKSKKAIEESSLRNPPGLKECIMEKHLRGRPTKYHPNLCIKIKILMAEGKSLATVAVELGITHDCILSWKDPNNDYFKHDFYLAVKEGEKLSQRWWEEQGRMNLYNKEFNSTLYMMNMQNRFGWTRNINGKIDSSHTEKKVFEVNFSYNSEEAKEIVKEFAKYKLINDSEIVDAEVH